jgi:glyoxylase I family protein
MDFGELRSSCQLLNVQTRDDRIWVMNNPADRERVQGIGGFFFRSADPDSLARWYQRQLGIDPVPKDYNQPAWQQGAGPTAFAPFPKDTTHFGSMAQAWMLNLRVRNLDAMVAQLRASPIVVDVDSEAYPNGRFARLHDPEGNPVELWEPAAPGERS